MKTLPSTLTKDDEGVRIEHDGVEYYVVLRGNVVLKPDATALRRDSHLAKALVLFARTGEVTPTALPKPRLSKDEAARARVLAEEEAANQAALARLRAKGAKV